RHYDEAQTLLNYNLKSVPWVLTGNNWNLGKANPANAAISPVYAMFQGRFLRLMSILQNISR
ncbi:hypothetical protein, partial [uncultured Croceicoccus sp.]|uniref:hypothetical protein n=1 Tax=uncultured Croceicoccus sp. TaxID=1295329 RepID=UPI002622E557